MRSDPFQAFKAHLSSLYMMKLLLYGKFKLIYNRPVLISVNMHAHDTVLPDLTLKTLRHVGKRSLPLSHTYCTVLNQANYNDNATKRYNFF